MAEFSHGIEGFHAFQLETTPGTKPSWTPDFLLYESSDLKSTPTNEKLVVAANSRAAHRNILTFLDNGGPVTLPLYPNSGAGLLVGLIGMDTYLTAITADAVTTSPISTANGISTITLAGTKSGYKVAAWVKVNTGASTEYRQIITMTPTNGTSVTQITVPALVINASAIATTVVQQVAQHRITPIAPGTTTSSPTLDYSGLRSYTYEDKQGTEANSHYYLQTYVAKGDFTFDDKLVKVQYQMESAGGMTKAAATTFAGSAADMADAVGPFAGQNLQFTAYGDPTGGASGVQLLSDWKQMTMSIDNNFKKRPRPGNANVFKYPTAFTVTGKHTYPDSSGRWVEYEDAINTGGATDNLKPLFMGMAVNQATSGSPTWAALGIHIPAVKYTDFHRMNTPEDEVSVEVTWEAQPDAASDSLVEMFLLNQTVAVY